MTRQGPVLVVDDEPDVGSLVVALLQSEGYPTALASSGKQALELVARLKPAAVVLDLSLPDLDGLQVLHTLKTRSESSHIPVIVVSAYTARLSAADKDLLHAVFEKPFDLDELTQAVARLRESTHKARRAAAERPVGPSIVPVA